MDDECACTNYFFLCCLLVDQYHKILCEEGMGGRTSSLLLYCYVMVQIDLRQLGLTVPTPGIGTISI